MLLGLDYITFNITHSKENMKKERRDVLLGKQFGNLTPIRDITEYGSGRTRWICKCTCGNFYEASSQALKNGKANSCGCLTFDKQSIASTSHGMAGTPEYLTWGGMKQRCLNPKNDRYSSYGGRGITVCDSWLVFDNFYADMGSRPEGKTIDRKDNDKGYSLENCRWATPKEQQNNTRSSINILYKGVTKTLTQWCEELNLSYIMVSTRLARGWEPVKALETPCDANQIELTFGGTTRTIKEWVKITGINQAALYTRWKRGWSDEKTLTTPIEKKQIEYSALEYNAQVKSLSEWCTMLNLDRRIMWKRLKRNWSVSDCFETPVLNKSLKLKNIKPGGCG